MCVSLTMKNDEDWLVVDRELCPSFEKEMDLRSERSDLRGSFDEDGLFYAEESLEEEDLEPSSPFDPVLSPPAWSRELVREDARTAFLNEAKRHDDDFFLVDANTCGGDFSLKFDFAAWVANWPVKELVAASTVIVTLKLLTAITNRITPRLL